MTTLPKRLPIGHIRLDQLYTLLALVLIGVFIALVPTPPNDFWWHLKAGQLVAEQGIPTTNLFAWTLPADQPYIYATWLGEWLFYQLYAFGGLSAVALARNLLGVLGFALVAYEAQQRSDSWRLAALAVLLAGLMTINNLIIRTQIWAWLPFTLTLLILARYVRGQASPGRLVWLPVLMAFWVNVHGSFVLGVGIVGMYAVGETLQRWLKQPRALAWERLRWLYIALIGTIVATLLNPLGFGIFEYVVRLLTDQPIQTLINEWQPPTPRSIAGMFFFGAVIGLLVALAKARRAPSITDLLLLSAFLWLAFGSQRSVIWFGLLAMPILAQALAAPRSPLVRPTPRVGSGLLNAFVALLLLGGLLAVQPPLKTLWPFPDEYRSMFAPVPGAPLTFGASTPVAATEWLRQNQPASGKLFNEMGYGSYLIWALGPQTQVFIDTRIELFPYQLWQDYQAISEGRSALTLLDQYEVTRVMLDRGLQPELSTVLAESTAWVREYYDPQTEIYRRR
jgi:hypothetical protein